ncbi:hypothetical protein K439DRAFT_1628592 [Ramaria rubella]|nr:hypothetical protein K439DRAFT_1628592 [Ramaria rubella]
MAQYAHLSTPDEEWLKVADSLPKLPHEQVIPLDVLRTMTSGFSKATRDSWEYPKTGVQVTDTTIPVQGASIVIRTYVPESSAGSSFPVLVWFHAGGYRFGDVEIDETLLRLVSKTCQVSCVNVEYRLAPEHPFPIPVQDCFDAVKWVASNPSFISADLNKGFLIGGTSSGGNLAAVVALKARDDPQLQGKITGQILQVPIICAYQVFPEKYKSELLSFEQNKDAPILPVEQFKDIYGDYAPDLTSTDFSPLLAASHRGLPPAYLQICGWDPLRDEGILYEKLLRENGVPTKMAIYSGLPHGFWTLAPQISQAKKYRSDTTEAVKWLLEIQNKS